MLDSIVVIPKKNVSSKESPNVVASETATFMVLTRDGQVFREKIKDSLSRESYRK